MGVAARNSLICKCPFRHPSSALKNQSPFPATGGITFVPLLMKLSLFVHKSFDAIAVDILVAPPNGNFVRKYR